MNAWDHLPNAEHIDRIFSSVVQYEKDWNDAGKMADQGLEFLRARLEIRKRVDSKLRLSILDSLYGITSPGPNYSENVRIAAWPGIITLIAYDDCAYMLDSDPGELALVAAFGDPRAMLLLPACNAFHSIKIKEELS